MDTKRTYKVAQQVFHEYKSEIARVLRRFYVEIRRRFRYVYFLCLQCIIKQLSDPVFVICGIINVSVRVICLAFGSADRIKSVESKARDIDNNNNNSYRDIDNSACHKNRIIVEVKSVESKARDIDNNNNNSYRDIDNSACHKNRIIVLLVNLHPRTCSLFLHRCFCYTLAMLKCFSKRIQW